MCELHRPLSGLVATQTRSSTDSSVARREQCEFGIGRAKILSTSNKRLLAEAGCPAKVKGVPIQAPVGVPGPTQRWVIQKLAYAVQQLLPHQADRLVDGESQHDRCVMSLTFTTLKRTYRYIHLDRLHLALSPFPSSPEPLPPYFALPCNDISTRKLNSLILATFPFGLPSLAERSAMEVAFAMPLFLSHWNACPISPSTPSACTKQRAGAAGILGWWA